MSGAISVIHVVPANARTHNPWRSLSQKALATVPKRDDTAYGSRRSPGRRVAKRSASRTSSRSKQPSILRLVPHGGHIGTKGRAAEIVERGIQRPISGCDHNRLEQSQQVLAVGLAKGNKPRAGGYPG